MKTPSDFPSVFSRPGCSLFSPALFFSFLLASPDASAQLVNCDGVWTNKGCQKQAPLSSIEEVRSSETLGEPPEARRKRSLFHDLNMRNIQVRREFGVILDLSPTEDFCKEPSTTVDECQKRILEMEDRLSKRVEEIQKIRAAERAQKLEEERLRLEQKRLEIEYQRALAEQYRQENQLIIIDRERIRRRDDHQDLDRHRQDESHSPEKGSSPKKHGGRDDSRFRSHEHGDRLPKAPPLKTQKPPKSSSSRIEAVPLR